MHAAASEEVLVTSSDEDMEVTVISKGAVPVVPKEEWQRVEASDELTPEQLQGDKDTWFAATRHLAAAHPTPRVLPQHLRIPLMEHGSFTGVSFKDIAEKHTDHYFWCKTESKPSDQASRLMKWVEENYFVRNDGRQQALKSKTSEFEWSAPCKGVKKADASFVQREPCEECTRWSRQGTNKFVEIRTCKDCGRVEKTKKSQPPPMFAGTCVHAHTSFARSSKTTHRTFCEDCQTVIAAEPQETWKARVASGEVGAATRVAKPIESTLPDVTREQAALIVKMFEQLMKTHCRKVTNVTAKATFALLEDAYSMVLEEDAKSTPIQKATAHMHMCMVAQKFYKPERPTVASAANLEVVDLMTDPRVFVLLDECCNKSCHTRKWLERAKKEFDRLGVAVGDLFGEPKSYTGIGKKTTVGLRNIPFSIETLNFFIRWADKHVMRKMI